MRYENIIFDLDGTLTDSGPGIRRAVQHALKRFGIEENDENNLNRFIGPPLYDSFQRFYGIDPEMAKHGEDYFREYYKDKGIFENSVYDGVVQMLCDLKTGGAKLYIATSKPDFMMVRVIEHFDIAKYFDCVCGAKLDMSICTKKDVISLLKDARPHITAENSVMVGDREHDVLGAAYHNIPCIGVLWGYGSEQELLSGGAKHLAATPGDVTKIVLS